MAYLNHQYELSYNERRKYLSEGNLEWNFLIEDVTQKNMLTCKAGKAVAAISPYGDVQLCILMPVKTGNLREKSFKEIWYSNENKILNQQIKITPYDLIKCSKCKYLPFCIRCPSVAYIETQSLFALSPTACANTKWRAYQKQNQVRKEVGSFARY